MNWKDFKGSCNTFAWNDVRAFKASGGDFLAIGNKNTLIGAKCKVVDQGKETMIFAMH
jgi:hypothetical protein